ncbi:hypothetical protein L2C96_05800 [Amycolatopsis tucumanensis]|nr:hypothetical protein [Amycolatopsis tucumanensis]MCF6421767.1 hypothetical protein [Amycolatopsis tucumanensis]
MRRVETPGLMDRVVEEGQQAVGRQDAFRVVRGHLGQVQLGDEAEWRVAGTRPRRRGRQFGIAAEPGAVRTSGGQQPDTRQGSRYELIGELAQTGRPDFAPVRFP